MGLLMRNYHLLVCCSFHVVNSSVIKWKEVELEKALQTVNLPLKRQQLEKIEVNYLKIQIDGNSLAYRECVPKSPTGLPLLLLPRASGKSNSWEWDSSKDNFMIQTMCYLGCRVVAIDLPGHGKSTKIDPKSKPMFLLNVVKELFGDSSPVLVSPLDSSAEYSLPLLKNEDKKSTEAPNEMEEGKTTTRSQPIISGFVAIGVLAESLRKDPESVKKLKVEKLELTVPTMIVLDSFKGFDIQSYPIPYDSDMATSFYVAKKPEMWNQFLYNFQNLIQKEGKRSDKCPM